MITLRFFNIVITDIRELPKTEAKILLTRQVGQTLAAKGKNKSTVPAITN